VLTTNIVLVRSLSLTEILQKQSTVTQAVPDDA